MFCRGCKKLLTGIHTRSYVNTEFYCGKCFTKAMIEESKNRPSPTGDRPKIFEEEENNYYDEDRPY